MKLSNSPIQLKWINWGSISEYDMYENESTRLLFNFKQESSPLAFASHSEIA